MAIPLVNQKQAEAWKRRFNFDRVWVQMAPNAYDFRRRGYNRPPRLPGASRKTRPNYGWISETHKHVWQAPAIKSDDRQIKYNPNYLEYYCHRVLIESFKGLYWREYAQLLELLDPNEVDRITTHQELVCLAEFL